MLLWQLIFEGRQLYSFDTSAPMENHKKCYSFVLVSEFHNKIEGKVCGIWMEIFLYPKLQQYQELTRNF